MKYLMLLSFFSLVGCCGGSGGTPHAYKLSTGETVHCSFGILEHCGVTLRTCDTHKVYACQTNVQEEDAP